jgi:truncated hemoglobin YjbI
MRSLLRWWLAPVAAAALAFGLAGPGRAADEPHAPHDKNADQRLYDLLRDVINEGADLYNRGDYAGCYHLWEGSLRTVAPFLDQHPDWQKAIDGALAEARGMPVMWERDWVLRRAMDKIRDDIHPPKKGEGATAGPAAPPEGPGPRPAGTQPPVAGPGPGTKGPAPRPEGTEPPKATTLWDRLGGEKGVAKVVDDLVEVAGKDPKVDFTRAGKFQPSKEDLAKFKRQMVEWVSSKTGGPLKYSGESMKKAHEGMRITDAQFDALAADLKSVLEKDGVKGEDQKAILGAVEATRKDIVEKTTGEEPEKKPEKKPEEKKPEEKKNGETKSGEKKPEDKKPEEKKPEDKKPEEKKSGETKSGDDKKSEEKKSQATVMGHVTLDGKPLPGTITLTGKDGAVASGAIAEDGKYAVEGVKPGSYTVSVKASGDKAKSVAVPEKYGDAQKSPLACEVKDGQNIFDLDLRK